MTSLALVLVLLVLVGLGGFFWFWLASPRNEVPPHIDDREMRRLELQDRIRQTNYQVLTAFGLAATFLVTVFQFLASNEHWAHEFQARLRQERLGQFVEAVKQINSTSSSSSGDSSEISAVAGIQSLSAIVTQSPDEYHQQANSVLTAFVTTKARNDNAVERMFSFECSYESSFIGGANNGILINQTDKADRYIEQSNSTLYGIELSKITPNRREAHRGLQAAMSALGSPRFSSLRVHSARSSCQAAPTNEALQLEHLYLDDLELSGLDYSCSRFSQSRFRRTSFAYAKLSNTDFRGATLSDYTIPRSPAAYGDQNPFPEWQRGRCWSTNFEGAELHKVDFEGATLDGANFNKADLTGANLCRADISRASFVDAKGLTAEMLNYACVGKPDSTDQFRQKNRPLTDIHPAKFRKCSTGYKCPYEQGFNQDIESVAQTNLAASTHSDEKIKIKPNVGQRICAWIGEHASKNAASACAKTTANDLLALAAIGSAFILFKLVGWFAKSKLEITSLTGEVFQSRFPERSLRYSDKKLDRFVRNHPTQAQVYRSPVLFPLDFLVMVALAGSMAIAGSLWLREIGSVVPEHLPFYALISPSIYLIADLYEDALLAKLLSKSARITPARVRHLKQASLLKFVFIWASIIQTIGAFGYLTFLRLGVS